MTPLGWILCVAYLGLPVIVLGNAADLLFQWVSGRCVGVWCVL